MIPFNCTMTLTRDGIAIKLAHTPYVRIIGSTCYHFSSRFYLNGFDQRLKENRVKINNSLSHRFGFKVTINDLADLWLYIKIEKRGFYITNTESGATLCRQDQTELTGRMQMKSDSKTQ